MAEFILGLGIGSIISVLVTHLFSWAVEDAAEKKIKRIQDVRERRELEWELERNDKSTNNN